MKRRLLSIITIVVLVFTCFCSSVFAQTITASQTLQKTDVMDGATAFNGHYYKIFTFPTTWSRAKQVCEAYGGHLVTITSKAEDDFCYDLFSKSPARAAWIGATDAEIEGIWKWITGEPFSYTAFHAGEPNGGTDCNYATYYYRDNSPTKWDDTHESSGLAFICEWEEYDINKLRGNFGIVKGTDIIYNDALVYDCHVYKVFTYNMTWSEAVNYCKNLGGHMATVTSAKENKALFAYLVQYNAWHCTLGSSDEVSEGFWTWENGEPFTYQN